MGLIKMRILEDDNLIGQLDKLDDILNKTADFYDEELETTIQTSVALLEPILIVIMGLIIAFIVISVMLPMFDTYSQI